jgi:hypothetical protein
MMEMKLELVPVPFTGIDRVTTFSVDRVGFNPDHDHRVNETLRFVPPRR